jgi:hypothetical protein
MKKVSKKVKSDYSSLNGDALKKIKGGKAASSSGAEDRLCGSGCSSTAAFASNK